MAGPAPEQGLITANDGASGGKVEGDRVDSVIAHCCRHRQIVTPPARSTMCRNPSKGEDDEVIDDTPVKSSAIATEAVRWRIRRNRSG